MSRTRQADGTIASIVARVMELDGADRMIDRAVELYLRARDRGGDVGEALFSTWALGAIPAYTARSEALGAQAARDGVTLASAPMPHGFKAVSTWGGGEEVAYARSEALARLAAYLLALRAMRG